MNIRVFSIKQLSSLFHYATCTIQYKDCTRDIKCTQGRDGVKISTAMIFLRSRLGKKKCSKFRTPKKNNFSQSSKTIWGRLFTFILDTLKHQVPPAAICLLSCCFFIFFLSRRSKNGPCLSMSVFFFFFFTHCARTLTWARPGRGRSSTGSAR